MKSDSELDHLLKKVVAQAEAEPINPAPQASTSCSSKDVSPATIVEDVAAEKEEERAAKLIAQAMSVLVRVDSQRRALNIFLSSSHPLDMLRVGHVRW